MHIKQIIIENFKSYGERTVLEPFDQGHNVIVGPNGAGKSNLFYAIQFVLSDEFTHLKVKERRSLLHDGQGFRTESGYVEVIFDNSDRRISFAEDEVSIRRAFNENKDEYTLNKKVTSRVQVMDALQAAGFTIRNPYYIVQQGKVNLLATSNDNNRLELLKKVAGLELYAQKYTKCLAKLNIAQDKLLKMNDILKDYKDRLDILEQEQEDFRQFEKHDKLRRTLELLIYESELNHTKQKLTDLEVLRNGAGNQQVPLGQKLQSTQAEIDRYLRTLKETKMTIASLEEEKEGINRHYQHLIKAKVKLTLTVEDLKVELKSDGKAKVKAEKELATLTNQIQESDAELEKVNRRFEKVNEKRNKKIREITLKEQQRKELYAKQNRGNQFLDKEERDIWIRRELELINKQITVKREHEDCLGKGIKVDVEIENQLVKKSEECARTMEEDRAHIEDYKKRCRDFDKSLEQRQFMRNEIWRKENIEDQHLSHLKEELTTANLNLCAKVGRSLVNGNESIRKVLSVFEKRGGSDADIVKAYHGTVLDNFECDKKLHTAVEVIAGNRLLYHIVDSDQVATKILNEINRMKLNGEVNFLPINRLHFKDVTYPNNKNAIPMVQQLSYEAKYDKVFRFLFRRTLICRDFELAIAMARSTSLECVTMEGDKVTNSGTLSGGYIDTSKLRLEIHSVRQRLTKQIEETTQKFLEVKSELEKIDSTINNIQSEVQKYKNKIIKTQVNLDRLDAEMLLLRNELTGVQEIRASKEKALAKSQSDLESLLATKQSLDLELEQDLLSQLSKSDQAKLNSLNKEIQILHKDSKKDVDDIIKLGKEKNKVYNFSVNNLLKKRIEVLKVLKEISFEERKNKLSAFETELEESNERVKCAAEDLKEMDCRIKKVLQQLDQEQKELTKLTLRKKDVLNEIEVQSKILETFVSKQILLDRKIAEMTVKIDEVGGVPSDDMYKQYSRLSLSSLLKEMANVTKLLKKYCHVNKKAVMQAESYSTELENLLLQKKEEDLCLTKIQDLLVVLNNYKFQALFNAFVQVSKNFTEVFKKLVPAGKAKMVMLSTDVEEGYEYLPHNTNMDNFVGVAIRVSFTDKEVRMKEMMQLSGGQKSLVALGLIFAIQKFNPAPFYLFDEIDQALDKNYRKALAKLIHELSDGNQFITTTFRPQLLKYAKKFYGVVHGNNCSLVNCITKNNATNFVGEDDDDDGDDSS